MFVVGGGPAGLAAAIAARMKGLDAAVADAARPPIDKACGEGVMPAGIQALQKLGVRLSNADGFPIRGIRFVDGALSVKAEFRSECGLGVRRTRLHEVLASRASELGISLFWGTPITNPQGPCPCEWMVGADGENSRVRRAAGLDAGSASCRRFGFRRHFRVMPWTDFVEVHWGAHCQIYVTPVSEDEVGIAVLSGDARLRVDDALREFPEVRRKLQGAKPMSSERGAVTVSRRLRRVFRGRTVLVGDASGSVDAITGEGLSLAFHQALSLSDALCSGDLESYQANHSRLSRRSALVARVLLSLDRLPRVRKSVLGMMERKPSVFGTLVNEHTLIANTMDPGWPAGSDVALRDDVPTTSSR